MVLAAPDTEVDDGAKEVASSFKPLVPFDVLLGLEEGASEGELN
jgi:hypothetical protein